MVTRALLYICLAFLSAGIPAFSAQPGTEARIFDRDVRTLSVRNPENFMSPPLIRLGTDDRLVINFDIIGDSHEYLRYRLIHCNADWQPSRLLESEYLDGFNEAQITDYAYSSNTFVHFVNYNILIPNPDMSPLVSGNYLLQVFPEDDPENILLQTRFSVSENIVPVNAAMTTRTDRGFNTEWQQLSLDIDLGGAGKANPYQDLIVEVTQNNRSETSRTVTHPLRVDGTHAVFASNPSLVFPAGNEYRRFETVRTDYAGMGMDSVVFGGTNWHAYLKKDSPRAGRQYSYDRTQHGRFLVDEYNSTEPDLGADYVTVHFTLDAPEAVGADVYVTGDFALNRLEDSNRMTYDYNTRSYHAEIPLKQGSYNYQYAVVPKSTGIPDPAPIEGNLYETSNEYLVKVFFRPPGARYDRLIGTVVVQ